ncbi:hypothetical protein ACFQBY_06370 [Promicromonospora citrea]|uniref:Uncharacterized protein n=1 Tax=Promicromonospora citrea TaxID=43677 RepID=A0A8H9GFX6_9MICO|nr:hypothetical protein [Promicromonospora citrea]NNH52278.1 hypothetical protein [Promicromonospora citrea]GGM13396.1 hypothetical protein GCM10010102_06200 [Promicromonospora citrea]
MTTLVTPAVPGPGGEHYPRQPAPGLPPGRPPGMLPGSVPPGPPSRAPRRGWWRRNAVWLLLLPLAVVVAAGASSFRVWAFWWPTGLHEEVDRVAQGGVAHLTSEYLDLWSTVPGRAGTTVVREVDVTVTGVEQVTALPAPLYGDPTPIPEGSAAYAVRLHLAAEPQTDLLGCQVVLVADDGTRYGEDTSDALTGTLNRCLPADAEDSLSVEPAWDVTSYVLVDPGVTVAEVWLAFGGPEYVTIDLP